MHNGTCSATFDEGHMHRHAEKDAHISVHRNCALIPPFLPLLPHRKPCPPPHPHPPPSRPLSQEDREVAIQVIMGQGELGALLPGGKAAAAACGSVLEAEGAWLGRVTAAWQRSRISNFDYLLYCNLAAGRSFNDLTQWPVGGRMGARAGGWVGGALGRGARLSSRGDPLSIAEAATLPAGTWDE
jgi:hypothetical protein